MKICILLNGYDEMYCASYFQGKSHTFFVFGSQILGRTTVSHVHFSFISLEIHIQILLVNLV